MGGGGIREKLASLATRRQKRSAREGIVTPEDKLLRGRGDRELKKGGLAVGLEMG